MHTKIVAIPEPVPLPSIGDMNARTPHQLIGMLHVPSTSILAAGPLYRDKFGLPSVTPEDMKLRVQVTRVFNDLRTTIDVPDYADDFRGVIATGKARELDSLMGKLSFMRYLEDRALRETEMYLRNGITVLQMENIGAPYAVRTQVPVLDQLLMNKVAGTVRTAYPNLPMGIQVLSYADNIALEIALQNRLFYVRGESLLFEGIRPEGRTPNQGNLNKLYDMRSFFNILAGRADSYPRIYPDLVKKHTMFPDELKNLAPWLHNMGFMKLEGIIITGQETGAAAEESDMITARHAVDALEKVFGIGIPLGIGSGANRDNISTYKKHANFTIIGSSTKRGGYWENELDEPNLQQFMETYRRD